MQPALGGGRQTTAPGPSPTGGVQGELVEGQFQDKDRKTRARQPDTLGNKKGSEKHKEIATSLEKKLQDLQGRARAGANLDTEKRDFLWPLRPAG